MINILYFQIWWVLDIYCLDQKNKGFNNNTQRALNQESLRASEKTTAAHLPMKIWRKSTRYCT